ncbi:MetQ/NlpA family ABC transporter substrate-binding protein [Psychrobacillus sp. OK032]|uniref:MetQ/NlpA family ABC transporter substrate-binding protein n=1 Tax=Psychrobacillus sp. OK032 TaxID=1884358 RepID=UPI0008D6CE94|nr:MetQ/NlpA family ABC transporter substrate-binding protein [Psychrobacillus sp. OK032]SES09887.1 D-methionine transport system substrate-binding protein [Psychrobacillus sp. OK032]
MKKWFAWSILTLFVLLLAACGSKEEVASSVKSDTKSSEEPTKIKISASTTPHAEILQYISDDLKAEGIELDIIITQDGIQTNQSTADGDLDANFFQHTPFLEQVNKDSGIDLVNVKGVHIEPFGVYSKKINDFTKLDEGAKVAVPNDPVNFSRALLLFADNGIIELASNVEGSYTVQDITKNDKKLEFVDIDGPLLVRALDDVDVAAINTNYALEGGFKPLEDALIIEGNESPYVNILVSRKDNQNDDAIQKLAAALTTEKVREFILEKYEGAVVPAF